MKSCTILTTTPNAVMEPIHNRMPVILTKDAEPLWLDPNNSDISELRELLVPYPANDMVAYQVSPLVNSANNDVPECISPLNDTTLE